MTSFQRWVVKLIGLDPYLYRPINTDKRWNAFRDMTDAQIDHIDNEFERLISKNGKLYLHLVGGNKIEPHEFIIEMMRGYDGE